MKKSYEHLNFFFEANLPPILSPISFMEQYSKFSVKSPFQLAEMLRYPGVDLEIVSCMQIIVKRPLYNSILSLPPNNTYLVEMGLFLLKIGMAESSLQTLKGFE